MPVEVGVEELEVTLLLKVFTVPKALKVVPPSVLTSNVTVPVGAGKLPPNPVTAALSVTL